MPKPVKKTTPTKAVAKKIPVVTKAKRPSSDPNTRAHQMLAEHMAKADETVTAPHGDPFEAQFKARMAELGSKGGKISGAKRMEMPETERKAIAKKGAAARWNKQ